MSITCITEVSMYLQYWQKSSKENSRSQCEYVRTSAHSFTHKHISINPFWRGKHEITVDTLDRKQKNVWGWLNKMKKKRRRERGRDRERRPRGSTHTLFYHQQAAATGPNQAWLHTEHRASALQEWEEHTCQSNLRPQTEPGMQNWTQIHMEREGLLHSSYTIYRILYN